MKIAILVEGKTEKAFMPSLRRFLRPRVNEMPNLDVVPCDGGLPKEDKLKKMVDRLLSGKAPADAVVAITDVYTGRCQFTDAADAKARLRDWAGRSPRFYPHAAQYEFEAWLIPYWDVLCRIAGSNRPKPKASPERINHGKPPSAILSEMFRTGTKGFNMRRLFMRERS